MKMLSRPVLFFCSFPLLGAFALLAAACSDCEGSEDVLIGGEETGFAKCGKFQHRVEARDCPIVPRSGEDRRTRWFGSYPDDYANGYAGEPCNTDLDCTARPNGYCFFRSAADMTTPAICHYGCVGDADCASDELCRCREPIGACVPAYCKTNADCEAGLCLEYDPSPNCGDPEYACSRVEDECGLELQCGANKGCTREDGGPSYCVDSATCD